MKKQIARLFGVLFIILLFWMLLSPPRFWLNLTKSVDISPDGGSELVEKYQCRSCHRIGQQGSLVATDLNGITKTRTLQELQIWLANPKAMKASTSMPNFKLSDTEIQAILAYLQTEQP